MENKESVIEFEDLKIENEIQKEILEEMKKAFQKKTSTQSWYPLFGMIAGSWAYQLNLPTSDKDYFGVYAASFEDVVSIVPPVDLIDQHNPDFAIYEAEKFCRLIMKGNPKLIEPLFTEHLCIQNEDWKKLKQVRDCIFSQVTINQYVGYSASKLGDYEKGKGEGVKNLYHTLRLIREAKRIALRQPPKIWMEGEERQYLLDIRQGKVSPDIVKQEFKTLQTEINSLINSFPPETDIHVLNKWLVELRMKGILPSSQRSLLTPLSNTNHSLKDKAQQLLDQNQVKGQILCVIPSGSRLYGTSISDSSYDYIGIYVSPIEQVVSLFPVPEGIEESGIKQTPQIVFNRGMVLLEVLSAAKLFVLGNHRLIEIIFCDGNPNAYETKEWETMKNARQSLLTQTFVNHCCGLVEGQLKPLQSLSSKEEISKRLYHGFRLLTMAEAIFKGEPFQVVLNQEFADQLRKIRVGDIDEAAAQALIEKKKITIQELRKSGTLPKFTDKTQINNVLIDIRKKF